MFGVSCYRLDGKLSICAGTYNTHVWKWPTCAFRGRSYGFIGCESRIDVIRNHTLVTFVPCGWVVTIVTHAVTLGGVIVTRLGTTGRVATTIWKNMRKTYKLDNILASCCFCWPLLYQLNVIKPSRGLPIREIEWMDTCSRPRYAGRAWLDSKTEWLAFKSCKWAITGVPVWNHH